MTRLSRSVLACRFGASPSRSRRVAFRFRCCDLTPFSVSTQVYRNFDATSMVCQQRLVCELHQNENTWGSTARKMNDAFR